jgi:hypothetical protein
MGVPVLDIGGMSCAVSTAKIDELLDKESPGVSHNRRMPSADWTFFLQSLSNDRQNRTLARAS